MANSQTGSQRKPTAEEARLWQRATADVPKQRQPPAAPKPTPTADGPPERFRDLLDAAPPAPKTTRRPVPPPSLPTRAMPPPLRADADHRRLPGLDKRTAARLKRGRIPIDRRIDLHGLTRDTAHRVVTAALAAAPGDGERCLLIITGKGARTGADGQAGVLRAELPRWLNEPGQRAHVLAIAAARPEHGGAGAVYVLVRRRRAK
jgi:DNA-nicking Smr family endonuclease